MGSGYLKCLYCKNQRITYLFNMKFLLPLLLMPLLAFSQTPAECDLLITNGRIVDGTGNGWYYGSIAIHQGRIHAIYRSALNNSGPQGIRAKQVIDARQLIVAPGFIDVHTHLEGDETKDPEAKNFIYDGVTTCITGNCGSSNVKVGNYLRWVDSLKTSINIGSLIGHNDVRKAVLGRANRDATPQELQRMESLVEKAMQEGHQLVIMFYAPWCPHCKSALGPFEIAGGQSEVGFARINGDEFPEVDFFPLHVSRSNLRFLSADAATVHSRIPHYPQIS